MKLAIVLLATALTVVAIPVAAADETHPDCESGQPGIGYRTTAVVWSTLGQQPVCEGEHWDGQDPINSQQTSCTGTVSLNPVLVGLCLGQDPNSMAGEDPATPLGVRVSSDGSSQAYAATNIGFVGRAVVYVGPGMAAVYIRDNTPGNVLATGISATRVTQGYVSENDCDQATYHAGAMNPPSECGRENMAVTVLLP